MKPVSMPVALQGQCWCAECAEPSRSAEAPDPLALRLRCSNDHRFYLLPDPMQLANTRSASALDLPMLIGAGPEEVARIWLSDSDLRPYLNPQLAMVLRHYLEWLDGDRIPDARPEFHWCPACRREMVGYDQPDVWMRGLRCMSGHDYVSRTGRLWCDFDGERVELEAEYSRSVVRQLALDWVRASDGVSGQLHGTVARTLQDVLRRV